MAVILLASASVLALAGCQQIEQTAKVVREKAAEAGDYVGEKVSSATTAIRQRFSGLPPDDETSCYATERVAFYDAVSEVKNAESLVLGAQFAGLVGAAVTTYSDSFATRLVSAGFVVTMAALVKEIEADHARIERVTGTFNDLVACRRGEAQRVKSDVRAGRLSRSDGETQLNNLKSLVEEDLVVAGEANETLQARTTEFQLSTEKAKEEVRQAPAEPERAGEPPPTPEDQREREQEVRKAEAAVQTNQQALSQQSATIEQARDLPQSDEFQLTLPGGPLDEGIFAANS